MCQGNPTRVYIFVCVNCQGNPTRVYIFVCVKETLLVSIFLCVKETLLVSIFGKLFTRMGRRPLICCSFGNVIQREKNCPVSRQTKDKKTSHVTCHSSGDIFSNFFADHLNCLHCVHVLCFDRIDRAERTNIRCFFNIPSNGKMLGQTC